MNLLGRTHSQEGRYPTTKEVRPQPEALGIGGSRQEWRRILKAPGLSKVRLDGYIKVGHHRIKFLTCFPRNSIWKFFADS